MAQSDNGRSTTTIDAVNAPRPQNSPGSKSARTHGDSSSWSSISSLKLRRNHDNDDSGSHPKRSVFSKVKEKARKLKKSLSGKKRRDDNELRSPNFTTPPGSAGPVKDTKQHPQFFSSPAPLQGSSVSMDTKKDSPKEHHQQTKKGSSETGSPPKAEPPPTTGGSPETTTKHDANDAKTSSETDNIQSNTQTQDKGVSVKEYLMNKLEPGEDERALSHVITQTISPKCEKVKEAVTSLLGTEETVSEAPSSEPDTTPADSDSNQDVGDRSSVESVDTKLTSLNLHDPSDGPETRLSNMSDISRGSESMSASCQNKKLEQSA